MHFAINKGFDAKLKGDQPSNDAHLDTRSK